MRIILSLMNGWERARARLLPDADLPQRRTEAALSIGIAVDELGWVEAGDVVGKGVCAVFGLLEIRGGNGGQAGEAKHRSHPVIDGDYRAGHPRLLRDDLSIVSAPEVELHR